MFTPHRPQTAEQTPLPGLTIPGEPLVVSGATLPRVIQEAGAAGFDVVRMDVIGASNYRLTLQRKPPCACDICAELTAPSDQIEAALRHTAELEAITSE